MKFLFFLVLIPSLSQAVELGSAVSKIEEIDQMRERLADTLKTHTGPITQDTFKQVCAPVGMSLQTWAKEIRVQARQTSLKFRNPKNKPTREETSLLKEFARNQARTWIIQSETREGISGTALYRRIQVREGCLHCHGPRAQRPEFVSAQYAEDRAFDFKPGELRGMYSIWLPTSPANQAR